MSGARIDPAGDEGYRVSGELRFHTARDLLARGARLIDDHPSLVFDLGGVSAVDSAGLALLIGWLRAARAREAAIHFTGIPPQLRALARASHLERLLP